MSVARMGVLSIVNILQMIHIKLKYTFQREHEDEEPEQKIRLRKCMVLQDVVHFVNVVTDLL